MTVARTLAAIRRALLEDPAVDIRFVDAITVDSHLLSTHGQALILFVHPQHREVVDELRNASRPLA